jgi:hypothetical protein
LCASDHSQNTWYNGTLKEGNYYYDYTGEDNNNDGIGDIPYNITGGSNQDLYPFIEQNGWLLPPNQSPNTPTITGEINGTIRTSYNYTIQTTDPDQDNVLFHIDWGDNATTITGLNESGEKIIVSHMWETKGTYSVKVKAIDENYAESDWANLTVTMPYSYNKSIPQILEWLFQRFPHVFPILRHLLGY